MDMDVVLSLPHPAVDLPRRSVFTHLLGDGDGDGLVGGFPAGAPAFIDAATGAVVTRAGLRAHALALGHALGPLARGAPVCVFSPNSIAWPVVLHAVAAAGLCATLANSAHTPAELAFQYADARAHLLLVHPALVHVALDALAALRHTDVTARLVLMTTRALTGAPDPDPPVPGLLDLDTLLARGTLPREVPLDGDRADATLYLCYSSGTSGRPKGVETTHYNLTSLIESVRPAWPRMVPCLAPTLAAADPRPDVFLGSLPYYHIYGAVKLLLFPLALGTPTVVMAGFHPVHFCEAIQRYTASLLLVVPPMLLVLARHDAIEKYDMSSVRILYSGAAPMGPGLVNTIRERLTRAGANAVACQAYGLTETSPTVTLLHPDDANTHMGSVGRVLPNIQAKLVRQDAGEVITDIDNAGELWVRGPTLMKGYWNNPTATASAITPDGWFKTGDIALSDSQGFLTIIDRRKELIKYKGFQVPPAELEALLLQHPHVADAAVVPVYDPKQVTELPRAYLVPTHTIAPHDTAPLALEIQSWVTARVAPHKRLRGGVVFVAQIPKSPSGKILRRELRERAKGEVGHGQAQAKL